MMGTTGVTRIMAMAREMMRTIGVAGMMHMANAKMSTTGVTATTGMITIIKMTGHLAMNAGAEITKGTGRITAGIIAAFIETKGINKGE